MNDTMTGIARDLHEKAASRPPHIERQPGDVLVAVLSHHKTLEDYASKDFTWFKCKKKHTVLRVKEFYGKKLDCKIDLYYGSTKPDDDLQVSSLDTAFQDGIVAFHAVVVELINSPSRSSTRTPLKAMNSQIPSNHTQSTVYTFEGQLKLDTLRLPTSPESASQCRPVAELPALAMTPLLTLEGEISLASRVSHARSMYTEEHLTYVSSWLSFDPLPTDSDYIRLLRYKWEQTPEGPVLRVTTKDSQSDEELLLIERILTEPPGPCEQPEITDIRSQWRLSSSGPALRTRSDLYSKESAVRDITLFQTKSSQMPSPLLAQPAPHSTTQGPTISDHYEMNDRRCILVQPEGHRVFIESVLKQPRALSEHPLTTWVRQNYRQHPGGPLKKDPNSSAYRSPYSFVKGVTTSTGKMPYSPDYPVAHSTTESGNASSAHRQPKTVLSPPPLPPKPSASNLRLQKILAEGSPEDLEAEVQISLALLEQLNIRLSNVVEPNQEAEQWFRQIENLKKQNINEPTIIGVVGNTGAGKSSVINAMLDEERLVPTNCMRACTAVVTEMSWNSSNDDSERYRADVEFIQPEDWEKELRVLFAELLDGSGKICREATSDQDSEAGVAYAKIRAVYPDKTKDEIAQSSVEQLMREPVIRKVLGTTKKIQEIRPENFYKKLQHYVDSREKQSDDKKREPEFWPLIKVVKIYTKSDALSTGAVIVDLPGVMDSNAARGNVAKAYMKKCTGLWIVAPINRAVDDRAAHNLMGDAFKRQLKFDGTYSRITFICSKTDDISVTEASESLGFDDQMSSKWDKIDAIEKDQKLLAKDLKELKESKAVFYDVLTDTDEQLEVWDKLKDDLEDGKDVFLPREKSHKRKRGNLEMKCRKKRASSGSSDEDDDSLQNWSSDNENSQERSSSQNSRPLTMDVIEDKISELKVTKKEVRRQRKELDDRMEIVKDQLKLLQAQHDKIHAEMSIICISGRNDYSKGAIQRDFAAGIKELDQEAAAEADEAIFNPDEDLRDYDEVARSLPVFCVSSRAYQKLSGRLKKDKPVPGFTEPDQTEIPQLQLHCKKLTEAGRLSTCKRFLNAFNQLVNSMTMWSSNGGSGINLSDDEVAAESRFLKSQLTQLEKNLDKAVAACLEEVKESLAENLYDHFQTAVDAAINDANNTAASWGAPVNRDNRAAGGLYWATYKAVCRRDGVFNNANGPLDFNSQISEPMIKQLGSHWETAFARRLPNVLKLFTLRTKELLNSFHKSIETRIMKSGIGIAGLAMLGQQLQIYERIFEDLSGQMMDVINERQRDANREFVPVVGRNLLSAYTHCTNESGPGQYMRMKYHMTNYVNTKRSTMFTEATKEVQDHLKHMCLLVEEQMSGKSDDVFVLMQRDYAQVITGSHVPQGYHMPKWERIMKADIANLIDPPEEREEENKSEEKTGLKVEVNVKDEMDMDNPLNYTHLVEATPKHNVEVPTSSRLSGTFDALQEGSYGAKQSPDPFADDMDAKKQLDNGW